MAKGAVARLSKRLTHHHKQVAKVSALLTKAKAKSVKAKSGKRKSKAKGGKARGGK
jgi:hypothetical protein